MSEQRNAEKDREFYRHVLSIHRDIAMHWLERAVSAEQRIAELTNYLECIEEELDAWVDANKAKVIIKTFLDKALNGEKSDD